MPISHRMRRVNRVALNKVTRQVVPWLPGLVVTDPRLTHEETRREIRGFARTILGLLHGQTFVGPDEPAQGP